MRQKRKGSLVYFVKPAGMRGPIKIGSSTAPEKRILALSYWSPFPLELIGCVPGELQDEQFLHDCFCHQHLHHEWFRFSDKMREAIDSILLYGMEFARTNMVRRGRLSSRCRTPEMRARTSIAGKRAWREKIERKTGIPRAN